MSYLARSPLPRLLLVLLFCLPAVAADEASRQWGSWRGPLSNGSAPNGAPPIEFGERENLLFKVELPGRGLSTPVIWGDRLFVTSAVPFGEALEHHGDHDHGAHDNVDPTRAMRFVALAYNRHDGRLLWSKTLHSGQPHEATHTTGSWASASAVTDGQRLIVSFGSQGLYGLTLDGKLLWERQLGQMRVRHAHGEGSSPALHNGIVVVNWDHEGDSFIAAFRAKNGKELWRLPRDEMTSWSSPLVVEHDGEQQVVVAATGRTRAYRLKDGKLIWHVGGLSRNVVATPVAHQGVVIIANSYDYRAMLAIQLEGASGDLDDGDQILWRRERDTPYVPSAAIHGGVLFYLKHLSGLLTAVDPISGERWFGPQRLGAARQVFASPVAAAGRLYVPSRDGAVAVVAAAKSFELLTVNSLDDSFSASPAIVGDTIYLRGERWLYAFREQSEDVDDAASR